MPNPNDENNQQQNTDDNNQQQQQQQQQQQSQNTSQNDDLQAKIQAGVDAALKDIKGKLDKAYDERDKANKKLAEAEQREKEAKLKQLEEEGKHKEALEIKLNEANAKIGVLEQRITELTRDANVREALSGLNFKNEKASKIAYKEIVEDLVLNDKGLWVHKSGISIKDFVEKFSKDEEQAFLFQVKTSNGSGGSGTSRTTSSNNTSTSLFKKSQAEVLEMARKGELPTHKRK